MDNLYLGILLFVLGASLASFLVVYKNRGGLKGRSYCENCKTFLSTLELVPILSYIFLKGKCSKCKSSIPLNLFLAELFLGTWYLSTFIYAFLYFELNNLLLVLALLLGTIFFYLVHSDMETMEVESKYLYLFLVVAIVGCIFRYLNIFSTVDILVPIIIFSFFYLLNFFKKQAIGEADSYIFLGLGLFYGAEFSISIFLYSVWFGTVYGIFYLVFINKKIERGIRIPFLPIIFVACLFIFTFNYHVIKISDILFLNEILFK